MRNFILLSLLGFLFVFSDSVNADERRERVILEAKKTIGWKEATGNNDGARIDEILAAVGLKGKQEPYCAAYIVYIYDRADLPRLLPRSAWSPDLVTNPTWKYQKGGQDPKPGDVFGIFFKSKNRIAHVGLVEKWGGSFCTTIEGNTSPDALPGSNADRDGQGIYRKRRLINQIYCVRSWL